MLSHLGRFSKLLSCGRIHLCVIGRVLGVLGLVRFESRPLFPNPIETNQQLMPIFETGSDQAFHESKYGHDIQLQHGRVQRMINNHFQQAVTGFWALYLQFQRNWVQGALATGRRHRGRTRSSRNFLTLNRGFRLEIGLLVLALIRRAVLILATRSIAWNTSFSLKVVLNSGGISLTSSGAGGIPWHRFNSCTDFLVFYSDFFLSSSSSNTFSLGFGFRSTSYLSFGGNCRS